MLQNSRLLTIFHGDVILFSLLPRRPLNISSALLDMTSKPGGGEGVPLIILTTILIFISSSDRNARFSSAQVGTPP